MNIRHNIEREETTTKNATSHSTQNRAKTSGYLHSLIHQIDIPIQIGRKQQPQEIRHKQPHRQNSSSGRRDNVGEDHDIKQKYRYKTEQRRAYSEEERTP